MAEVGAGEMAYPLRALAALITGVQRTAVQFAAPMC